MAPPDPQSNKDISASAESSTTVRWTPQDLTQDVPGFPAIPEEDYIRLYQQRPIDLWPVEFFVIPYRRICSTNDSTSRTTQLLVRSSSNGTAQWGLGTGVPVTRWTPAAAALPAGYEWSENPPITIEASIFPTFRAAESWTYQKIHLREDALSSSLDYDQPQLHAYAQQIRDTLSQQLLRSDNDNKSEWDATLHTILRHVLDAPNSVTAIQGSLRMSGVFHDGRRRRRRPPTTALFDTMTSRVYTMFPHMPDPLPPPMQQPVDSSRTTTTTRPPPAHHDRHGRIYTHISTANVSNTIHGIYMVLDVTELYPADDDDDDDTPPPPAYDLLGATPIRREWKALADLHITLEKDTTILRLDDPKPVFSSGHIVRQLVHEGVIPVR